MNRFTGTWRLVRLALRRDRVKLAIAIVSVGLLMPMFIAGISEIFSSEEEMTQGIAFLSANPVMRLFGLPTGSEFGNLIMLRTFTFVAIIIALISTFTVIRHTRQNEELGRFELIGAGVVGRQAGLLAAMIVAVGANAVMAILIYLGLLTGDLPASGAALMAVALGCVGIAFSGVAAICAQLPQTSRGANGLAAACIGGTFLLSGLGSILGELDSRGFAVTPAWPTWFSPFGWGQMLQPFAEENWWVLTIFAAFFIGSIGLAVLLSGKRDVGQGIFAARAGRALAKPGLLGMVGLTWRLQRGVFMSWLVGITLLAVIYGVVAGDVEDLLAQAEGIAEVFVAATGSEEILLAYFASTMSILGLFTLAYAIQSILRMRSEESGALEFLLSNSLGRVRWMLVHTGFVLAGAAVILFFAGIVSGLTAETVLGGTAGMLWPITVGALVQLPAIALLTGLVAAVFGYKPRWAASVAWTAVAASVVLGPLFGMMLGLPERLLDISPLTHTPHVPPIDTIEAWPLVIMAAIAVFLIGIGVAAFRRRDLTVS